MATFINRSAFTVSVKKRADLKRDFPFSAKCAAIAYCQELFAQRLKPELTQGEDHLLVRIRQKGFDEIILPAQSYQEAHDTATGIEIERRSGRTVDYSKGLRSTHKSRVVSSALCTHSTGANREVHQRAPCSSGARHGGPGA